MPEKSLAQSENCYGNGRNGFSEKIFAGYGFLVGVSTLECLVIFTWFAITVPTTWLPPRIRTLRFNANKVPNMVDPPLSETVLPVPRILKRTFEAGTFTREICEFERSEKASVTSIMKLVVAVGDKVKIELFIKTKSVSLSTTFSSAPPVIVSEL